MLRLLLRGLRYSTRFVIGVINFGWIGAFRAFVIYRTRTPARPTSLVLRKARRRVFYRGAADEVIKHFYTEQYRIRDTDTSRVRYIIDAGAHIGDQTIRFRYFHPEARIIAIEAEPANFHLLVRNVTGDPLTTAINKGLWSKDCHLKVLPSYHTQGYRVMEVDDPTGPYDISAVTIEELMHEFSIPEIDILKMDIEGAEHEIFRLATERWLTKVKVLIFECPDNDSPGATMTMFDRLLRAGLRFNTYVHGENIIMIRSDVDWKLAPDLHFER